MGDRSMGLKKAFWMVAIAALGAVGATPARAIEEVGNQAEVEAASHLRGKKTGDYGVRVCTLADPKTAQLRTDVAARLQELARKNPKEFGAVLQSGDEVRILGVVRGASADVHSPASPLYGRWDYLVLEGTQPGRCYLVPHSKQTFHRPATHAEPFLRNGAGELEGARCLGRRDTDRTAGVDGPRSPRTLNATLKNLASRLWKSSNETDHRDTTSPLVSATYGAGVKLPEVATLGGGSVGGNIVRLPEFDCQQMKWAAVQGKAFDERGFATADAGAPAAASGAAGE